MLMLLAWPARPAQSGNFVFYFPKTHSILPMKAYQNVRYLPALKLLNLFGHVAGIQAKRKTLKVWFESTEIRFREKNPTVRLNNAKLRLSNPPQTMEGEWMVPVDFLTEVLPTLINQTVEYQKGQNRIFIGNVKPNSFTVHMEPLDGGTQLTFQFADPISLRTAARNSRWILYLGSHPVEPIQSSFEFQNSYVSRVQFEDQDGHPKLVLTPAVKGLDFYPKLGNENKTLVADIMKPKGAEARSPGFRRLRLRVRRRSSRLPRRWFSRRLPCRVPISRCPPWFWTRGTAAATRARRTARGFLKRT